jgi:hypothetical protein
VRNAQEKLDQTIQGMVHVYVGQLTRYFKATLDGLFSKSASEYFTGLFSKGGKAKLDTDEKIEGEFGVFLMDREYHADVDVSGRDFWII